MHEMALVRTIVDMVSEECSGRDVASVRAVHLTIGELHDVVEELIPAMFRHLAKGTVAESAQVVIRHVPMTVRCNACGDIFAIDERRPETWECPRCHARRNYRLFSGDEFRIDRLEVERC